MRYILLACLISCSVCLTAQTIKVVDSLSKAELYCLENETDMNQCAIVYYHQMDSMLNVVYEECIKGLSNDRKLALKKDELIWLKKRDQYFAQLDKDYEQKNKTGEWGREMRVTIIDRKAHYVKDRVLKLHTIWRK